MEIIATAAEPTKMSTLLSFLKQLPHELEMIADEVDHCNLRDALNTIAVETQQYAQELRNETGYNDLLLPVGILYHEAIERIQVPMTTVVKGKELISICDKTEYFFVQLYNDVLADLFMQDYLKELMTCQLNGIRMAFQKLRLLNQFRYN